MGKEIFCLKNKGKNKNTSFQHYLFTFCLLVFSFSVFSRLPFYKIFGYKQGSLTLLKCRIIPKNFNTSFLESYTFILVEFGHALLDFIVDEY